MAWYNWSQTAASNSNADSSINWAEGQAPSSVNDSARAMMAATAKYRDDVNGSLLTGGTLTAYTLTSNSSYDTLAHLDKQMLVVTMHATSGATPTLNVDSLGAKPIRHATGATLPTGALLLGSVYRLTYYNTAGEFLISDQLAVQPANSVATSSIATSAVTYAKIQNEAATSLLGNPTGSPTAPAEITLGAGLAFSGTTLVAGTTTTAHGVALFEGAAALGNSGAGTLGQALISGGASADPSFKSGAMVLINTLTASNSVSLSDTSSLTSAYNEYEVVFENILAQTNAVSAQLQLHSGGTFQSTGYLTVNMLAVGATVTSAAVTTNFPCFQVGAVSNSTPFSGTFKIYTPAGTAAPKTLILEAGGIGSGAAGVFTKSSGCWNGNGAIDGFQMLMSSGNIVSGTIKIYGIL